MGRPLIQLPEDVIRVQEAIWRARPEVIVETGVAHGGSLVFYASLLAALGAGRVIGVDIHIRPENRAAIEAHPLASRITLIEGPSVAPDVVSQVRTLVGSGARAFIVLDSDHSRVNVLAELEAYAELVAPGSYIVATDGIMEDLSDVPRGRPTWRDDNPASAARAFAVAHPEFVLEPPTFDFDETESKHQTTYWPSAYLRRREG